MRFVLIANKKSWNIKDSHSIISFETSGGGNWKVWDRYITIGGKKAFHIGNVCDTCEFFFERLGGANGANMGISPKEISHTLEKGLTKLDNDFLSKVALILPNGEYDVSLQEVNPRFVELGTKQDYFSNEQVQVWGMDKFWGLPHSPKIKYYRGVTEERTDTSKLFEFIVPTFPVNWLDEETIDMYKALITDEQKPTALCLSVLDVKEPGDYEDETEYPRHWCLTHYIIDGHHKMYTASLLNKPITILSFLAKKECIATEEEISTLFKSLN